MDTLERGRRLRTKRTELGISRDVLAHKSGLSVATVIRAEQGRDVTAQSLLRILNVVDPMGRVTEYV